MCLEIDNPQRPAAVAEAGLLRRPSGSCQGAGDRPSGERDWPTESGACGADQKAKSKN